MIDKDLLKSLKAELNSETEIVERLYMQTLNEYMKDIDEVVTTLEDILASVQRGDLDNCSNEYLEEVALKLPTLMYRVGGEIERVGLKMDIIEAVKTFNENDVLIRSTGTIKEREAKAENSIKYEQILKEVEKRVYKQIDRNLEFADKIYSSVKKVMSMRIAELETFRRENAKNNKIDKEE